MEIYRTLRNHGTYFCLDWEKKEMEQGPPINHRIHSTEMEEAMKKAGFNVVSKTFPTDNHYLIIARKSFLEDWIPSHLAIELLNSFSLHIIYVSTPISDGASHF